MHNIRSGHNVGSIFRTADAAGFEKIYLCGVTPTPTDEFNQPRPQVTKVSLGAENYIKWEQVRQSYRIIERLKKEGYQIFAIEQDKRSTPYFKTKVSRRDWDKIALVVGNEINGLPESVLKRADKILEIPMTGKKESLNVSVAFAVAAFHLKYICKS